MPKPVLSLAAAAARWLPAPVKKILYRLGPVSRALRGSLNRAAPVGFSAVTIAGGVLAGSKFVLDLQTEKDLWLGTYEPDLQQAVQDWVRPGMTVYDVGANVGYVSLLLAKYCDVTGQVFAFEPLPKNQDRFQKNLDLNPHARVTLIPKALSDKSGKTTFLIHDSGGMGKIEGSESKDRGYQEAISVETTLLDEFVYTENQTPPDLIKLDIEGGEAKALQGAPRILKEKRPVLLIELHSIQAGRTCWEILTNSNYSIRWMRKGYPKIDSADELGRKAYILARPN